MIARHQTYPSESTSSRSQAAQGAREDRNLRRPPGGYPRSGLSRSDPEYYRLPERSMQKTAQDYSAAAFKRTTDLLDLNPEFYTIWNYRRNILSHGIFPSSFVHHNTPRAKTAHAHPR